MPLAQALVPQVGPPDPTDNGHLYGAALGVEPHDPFPQKHQGPDVGLLLPVEPQDFAAGRLDVVLFEGNLDHHDVAGIEQALNMLLQAKNGRAPIVTLVSPNAFKDSQAVVQGVGQDVDLGLLPGNEFAVEPDEFGLFHHQSYLQDTY